MAVGERRRFRQTFLSRVSLNTQWEIESYERFESELARTGYFHVGLKGTCLQRLWYIWELGSEDEVIDAEKAAFDYFVDLAVEEQVMADPTSPTRPLDEWDPRYFTCLSACFHAGEGTYEEFLRRMGYTSEDEIPGGEQRESAEAIGAFGQLEPDNIGAMGEVDSLWFKDISPEFQVWQDTFPFTMEAPQPDITSVWTGQYPEWVQQNLQEFNLEDLYSPDTTIDKSWYQYRAMSVPDSMLPPILQGGWEWDFEMFKSSQEFLRQREEEKARLKAQAQLEEAQHAYEESLVPQPDVTGAGIPKQEWIAPSRGELNQILQQEQHALRGWRSSPAPVSELTFISKFEAIKALEQYFLREGEGAPGDKINYLLMVGQGDFIPTAKEMSQVKEGDPVSLFFSGEPDVRRDIKQRYMTDDEYALELLRKYVAGCESPYVEDIELYLQQVADWKELTDNAPLPVGHKWFLGNPIRIERRSFLDDFNQQGPLNYVPPENEAFNVASSSGFGLPLGGYAAGFLGMPSGGGGTTTSSSLSLPGLGGGPSALPSPVGLGGVVGGVPRTPSVGLPGLGWGGAAMPAPSIGLSRSGGVSAPAMPAMGTVSPIGMPGGPAIPSSAPSAPVSAQGGPSGGGGGLDFASLLGGSRQSMIPGSQGFAGGGTAEASESISRAEKLVERLMQIPELLAMAEPQSLGSLGSSGKSAGDVSQGTQPQQLVRMVINRHEEISKEKLEQYVLAWLESQSRVG